MFESKEHAQSIDQPALVVWKDSNFAKLWVGQTISLFGSAITTLALPFTAIANGATVQQMGLLYAVSQLPQLLFGLIVGVWVDRVSRRRLLLFANLGQACLLALIPLASVLKLFRIEMLYGVGFLVGVLSLIFTIAFRSYLPSLLPRKQIVEGNSALQFSQSAAQVLGPNLAGILVQVLTAPIAIIGDVFSFVVSAGCVWLMKDVKREEAADQIPSHVVSDIAEGLRAVWQNPILRALALSNGTANIFWGAQLAILLLYMSQQLGQNAVLLGIVYTCGNSGFFVGTFLTKRFVQWWGLGRTLLIAPFVSYVGALLVPFVYGPFMVKAAILAVAQFLTVFPLIIYHIHETSLRQVVTPDRLQGRVNATMQCISWSTTPGGALLGGWLGGLIGIRWTLFVVVIGLYFSMGWLVFSPIRSLRSLPEMNV